MQDIYDIKGIMIGFPINIYLTLLFLFFLIIFYFLIFKREKKVSIVLEKLEAKQENGVDLKKILNEIEKNIDIYDDEIFYNKLDDILRTFLEQKGFKNIKYMTLDELLKEDIEDNLKDLFRKIYFKEFDKFNTDINYKKELITKIKNKIII